MLETEARAIREAFSSVAPHLTHPGDLADMLESLIQKASAPGEILRELEQAMSGETDPTRRTDCQIFVNELKRIPRKRVPE